MITLPSLLLLPAIWIVDAQMGPGAHFADLPAAIAVAASLNAGTAFAGKKTILVAVFVIPLEFCLRHTGR